MKSVLLESPYNPKLQNNLNLNLGKGFVPTVRERPSRKYRSVPEPVQRHGVTKGLRDTGVPGLYRMF